jgi:hypothetical protein
MPQHILELKEVATNIKIKLRRFSILPCCIYV